MVRGGGCALGSVGVLSLCGRRSVDPLARRRELEVTIGNVNPEHNCTLAEIVRQLTPNARHTNALHGAARPQGNQGLCCDLGGSHERCIMLPEDIQRENTKEISQA